MDPCDTKAMPTAPYYNQETTVNAHIKSVDAYVLPSGELTADIQTAIKAHKRSRFIQKYCEGVNPIEIRDSTGNVVPAQPLEIIEWLEDNAELVVDLLGLHDGI